MSVAARFVAACRHELAALKPGNVHVHADGHGMTVADFVRSAEVAGPPLCRTGAPLGVRIRDAVAATRAAVGQNTNLGIILLCAPLAAACEYGGALRPSVRRVLQAADRTDTQALFEAIVLASPAGLGTVERHDVRAPADVTPVEAMRAAAHRDSIARQWVTDFEDVFGGAMTAYVDALHRWRDAGWATTGLYMTCLATWPDSHVVRKHGSTVAAALQTEAVVLRESLLRARDPRSMHARLLAWDAALKTRGINPGTSADLTVATVFAFSGAACS